MGKVVILGLLLTVTAIVLSLVITLFSNYRQLGSLTASEAIAKSSLDEQLRNDRGFVQQQLLGRWTAQLSYKQLGQLYNGITYSYADIWADFSQFKAKYPTAILTTGEWFTAHDRDKSSYVTIEGQNLGSKAGVQAWCKNAGLTAQQCIPHELTKAKLDLTLKITIVGLIVTVVLAIVTPFINNWVKRRRSAGTSG